MSKKNEKISTILKIVCPFCNAPMDSDLEIEGYAYARGCDTCGEADANVTINISCHTCGRLVYKKEAEL